jgi:hypothetical protein
MTTSNAGGEQYQAQESNRSTGPAGARPEDVRAAMKATKAGAARSQKK